MHANNCGDAARLLDEQLSRPDDETVRALADLVGDIIILGAGGKMGPSLAVMARRASQAAGMSRRIIAVSRFTDARAKTYLERSGVETIQGDLLDRRFLDSLPDCANVVYMVGLKFGTSSASPTTWATNAFLPGLVCQKFASSRIASFSTGNVYPFVSVDGNGSIEQDELCPVGEYAMSAVARERILEFFSESLKIPMVVIRLNYATELRYGVLIDLAKKVLHGEVISLSTGHFNCIWQGDANNMALRSLKYSDTPPRILNLTGQNVLSVRDVCLRLGELMNKPVRFEGDSKSTALLSDSSAACRLLGPPKVTLDQMLERTAQWVLKGGDTREAPTHFEVRDGKF